jgi:hypothetical protein
VAEVQQDIGVPAEQIVIYDRFTLADLWLQNATELGLGTGAPQHIELTEVNLP